MVLRDNSETRKANIYSAAKVKMRFKISMNLPRSISVFLLVIIILVASVAGYYLAVRAWQVSTATSSSPALQQNTEPSNATPIVNPELPKLKLCPFDTKISIVSSSHRYRNPNPQTFIINAKRGDRVDISLNVVPNPNMLSCIKRALNLKPRDKLNVDYGLQLGSGDQVTIKGAKRMNISNIHFERKGELYHLRIAIDNDMESGKYYIVLYTWIKISGAVEIKSMTEHIIFSNIE
jgi:hypothetical protein